MESIHTNSPVIARALDFTQEVKRKREEEQQAAAKTENRTDEQHPNRVSFSQEAQIRLSEEKTHVANRVEAVRVTDGMKASEAYNQALRQEIQQADESRTADRMLREDRDRIARGKAATAASRLEASNRKIQESADAARKLKDDQTAKAIDAQTEEVKNIQARTNANAAVLDNAKRIKAGAVIDEKVNAAAAVQNFADDKKRLAATAENFRINKAIDKRLQAENAKAVDMYDRVKKLT